MQSEHQTDILRIWLDEIMTRNKRLYDNSPRPWSASVSTTNEHDVGQPLYFRYRQCHELVRFIAGSLKGASPKAYRLHTEWLDDYVWSAGKNLGSGTGIFYAANKDNG
jgi:hypothetical protein